MRILFDHNIPRRFRHQLTGHVVRTTREMHWEALENGELLLAASAYPFDVIICIDKKMEYEQNLKRLPLPVVVLDAYSNTITDIIPFTVTVLNLLATPLEKLLYMIERDGTVLPITQPRPKS